MTHYKAHSQWKGFTLVELMVSIGLFVTIMMIASGAYLIMIDANRGAQGITTGINNLSYTLENMTRSIRTGSAYTCVGANPSSTFSFTDQYGHPNNSYTLTGGQILLSIGGAPGTVLTDSAVRVNKLVFTCSGTPSNDTAQAHVTIVIVGDISVGPGKTQPFNVETSATMRGTDI